MFRGDDGLARSRKRELAVNTGLFTLSSFGSKIISFLLLPLYTAVLSTGDYGTVDLMNSTVSLLVPLLTLNIQDAILRFGLGKEDDPEEVLAVGLRVLAVGMCVLLLAMVASLKMSIFPFDPIYCVFLVAMFVLTSFSNILTMYVKSQDHVSSLVVSGIGNTLVVGISSVVFLVVMNLGVLGYMASMILGSLFADIYLFIIGKAWRGFIVKVRPGLFASMIAFCAPLVLNGLAWWVNDVSDRYVVTFICGAAANGIYAVAFKIPTILSSLQTIFYNAWAISAVKEFDPDDRDGFLGKTYEVYSGAMSMVCSGIMMLNIPLATFLFSEDFFEAWLFVPLLLVGVLLNGISLFEGCLFGAAKNTRAVMWTTIAGAVVGISSCILLTSKIGPLGAAIATVLGYVITWGVRTYVMTKRIVKLKVSWTNEFATLVVLLMQSVIAMQWELQLLQLPFFALIAFLRRKQFKVIVNTCAFKTFGGFLKK